METGQLHKNDLKISVFVIFSILKHFKSVTYCFYWFVGNPPKSIWQKVIKSVVQIQSCIHVISINLLAFYDKCRSLIGYASHYLFCCSVVSSLTVCGCQQNGGHFFTFSKCLWRGFWIITSRGDSREEKNCNEIWNEDFSQQEKESKHELSDFIHLHF